MATPHRLSLASFRWLHDSRLIYNTCWEDPRLDRAALRLSTDDVVVGIASAGCNALDYALDGPRRAYAADVNPRQNALLELKQAGIRALDRYRGGARRGDGDDRVLAPGGTIGIVDFYVSSPRAWTPLAQHGAIRRAFRPWWFLRAHVFLNGDHLPALVARFDTVDLHETLAPVPFMPAARVPVYRFVGRDRREPASAPGAGPGQGATLRSCRDSEVHRQTPGGPSRLTALLSAPSI